MQALGDVVAGRDPLAVRGRAPVLVDEGHGDPVELTVRVPERPEIQGAVQQGQHQQGDERGAGRVPRPKRRSSRAASRGDRIGGGLLLGVEWARRPAGSAVGRGSSARSAGSRASAVGPGGPSDPPSAGSAAGRSRRPARWPRRRAVRRPRGLVRGSFGVGGIGLCCSVGLPAGRGGGSARPRAVAGPGRVRADDHRVGRRLAAHGQHRDPVPATDRSSSTPRPARRPTASGRCRRSPAAGDARAGPAPATAAAPPPAPGPAPRSARPWAGRPGRARRRPAPRRCAGAAPPPLGARTQQLPGPGQRVPEPPPQQLLFTQMLGHGERRFEVGHPGDVRQAAAAAYGGHAPGQFETADDGPTLRRLHPAGEREQQTGAAAAGRPGQRDQRAGPRVDRHVAEGPPPRPLQAETVGHDVESARIVHESPWSVREQFLN